MQLGAKVDNTLVKGMKIRSKGKGKGVRFNMELDIPDLRGVIDAEIIGSLAVSEFIDLILKTWERGMVLPHRKRKVTIQMKRRRLLWNAILRKLPNNRREFTAMIKPIAKDLKALVRDQGDWAEIYSYIRKIDELNYIYTTIRPKYKLRQRTQRSIRGVQPSKFVTSVFLPDPDSNKAVVDSGLMAASLHGTYRRSRSYINKEGVTIKTYAQMVITVAKNRQSAAIKAGLSSKSDYFFTNMMNKNTKDFQHTNNMLSHGIYWADKRRAMTRLFTTLKIMYRVAQFAGRI